MSDYREQLLNMLLFVVPTLAAGGAAMILHGAFRHWAGGQPLGRCVTREACCLVLASVFGTLLLIQESDTVPWERLGSALLLAAVAPPLLAWLGPPNEHLEASDLCQIGKGSAWSHFYGYLVLMQKENGIRRRLEQYSRDNPSGLSLNQLENFHLDAVVVLAPTNGIYPTDTFCGLRGVVSLLGRLPSFTTSGARTYGTFGVYEVKRSDDSSRRLVAVDDISALRTLEKLRRHGPVGFNEHSFRRQMNDMLDELQKIIDNHDFLSRELKLVKYDAREHVGDAILNEIGKPR